MFHCGCEVSREVPVWLRLNVRSHPVSLGSVSNYYRHPSSALPQRVEKAPTDTVLTLSLCTVSIKPIVSAIVAWGERR